MSLALAGDDARSIVQRSIEAEKRPDPARRQYVYLQHEQNRELNGSGAQKSSEDKLFEVSYIGGKEYRRLLQRNGKPLTAQEAKREQEKIDRASAEAAKMSPAERARREAEADAKQARIYEKRAEVPNAFDFRLVGDAVVNGRAAWEIACEPKRDYKGKDAFLLRNMRGRLFIDKQDYHWSKAEAEVLENISIGLFLARVSKGSVVTFEDTRVNNEVWLPKSFSLKASARLALVKGVNVEARGDSSNYRRFSTDSQVVSVSSVESK